MTGNPDPFPQLRVSSDPDIRRVRVRQLVMSSLALEGLHVTEAELCQLEESEDGCGVDGCAKPC